MQVLALRDKLIAIRESQRKILSSTPYGISSTGLIDPGRARPSSVRTSRGAASRGINGQIAAAAGLTRSGIPGISPGTGNSFDGLNLSPRSRALSSLSTR